MELQVQPAEAMSLLLAHRQTGLHAARHHLHTMLGFTAFALASFKADTPPASHSVAARGRLIAAG
jgi:hypothetical protein